MRTFGKLPCHHLAGIKATGVGSLSQQLFTGVFEDAARRLASRVAPLFEFLSRGDSETFFHISFSWLGHLGTQTL